MTHTHNTQTTETTDDRPSVYVVSESTPGYMPDSEPLLILETHTDHSALAEIVTDLLSDIVSGLYGGLDPESVTVDGFTLRAEASDEDQERLFARVEANIRRDLDQFGEGSWYVESLDRSHDLGRVVTVDLIQGSQFSNEDWAELVEEA